MFTTGFKFYFGLFVAFACAALVYGYASGGDHIGPLSFGWKGSVGDHIGYGVLSSLAAVSLLVSLVLISFRDADPAAQAELAGVEALPPAPLVTVSFWPVIAAFGLGAGVIGLVLHPIVFALGLALLVVTLVEWTMDAWADRATSDSSANRELRNRIMAPIEIPVFGVLVIAVAVLAASRILLAVSALAAVIVAGLAATLILGAAIAFVYKPGAARRVVAVLAVVGALGLLVGGVLAAVSGERDFEHHAEDPAADHDPAATETEGQ